MTVLAALLFCVALSFLFSGMESGVLALNHFRIRQRMRAGDRRAAVLHGFLENPEDFLWTILVGNTVANFVIFSLGVVQLHGWLGRPARPGSGRVCRGRFLYFTSCANWCPRRSSTLSQPPDAGPGRALPAHSSPALAAGGAGGLVFPRPAPLDRRQDLHRPALRQPRGTALCHAGIRSQPDHRGEGHDQPRARPAKSPRAPRHHSHGRRRHRRRLRPDVPGAGLVPGAQFHPHSCAGHKNRPRRRRHQSGVAPLLRKLDRAKPARDYMEPRVFSARGTAPGGGPAPDAADRLPPGRGLQRRPRRDRIDQPAGHSSRDLSGR